MQVIPVIDIRKGVVVRAIAGRRSEYKPIETPLARTSAPMDVVLGLMSVHPFEALYIADLDAIEGRGENYETIEAISEATAHADLWVDAGSKRAAEINRWLALPGVNVVVGSETYEDACALCSFRDNPRVVLSLDFSARSFLGDRALLEDASLWPQRVIVMTLARVGAGLGPDLISLCEILRRAEGRRVFAAGGVRSVGDLVALKEAGAAGALVATALHDGRLTRTELTRLEANKRGALGLPSST